MENTPYKSRLNPELCLQDLEQQKERFLISAAAPPVLAGITRGNSPTHTLHILARPTLQKTRVRFCSGGAYDKDKVISQRTVK